MEYKLDFDTQYNQFYVCDKSSLKATDSLAFWTADSHEDRLALGDGIVGVGTQSYGHISGKLVVLTGESDIVHFDKYDHVVEGALELTSGVLQILDCPDSEIMLEINTSPGLYRIRVYSSGLRTTSRDDDEGDDQYLIEIWPSKLTNRKVLKRYQ